MNERIKELRLALNLSAEKFGAPFGVTRFNISKIETGASGITEHMIKSICREYNVNETWLRTGNGNMFNELTRAELAAHLVGKTLTTENDFILNTFIALGQLSPDDWKVIEKLVESIKHKSED